MWDWKRWRIVAAVILIVVGIVDFVRFVASERTAVRVVSECGGTVGSEGIGWPLKKDYRVTFHRALSSEELERLASLNSLRGSVAVAFVDCEISQEEMREALEKLPRCYLMRVTGGESRVLRELVGRGEED